MKDLLGRIIKHENFKDVALLVTSVGQLQHGATELHIHGCWMNQGMVQSFMIGETADIIVKLTDLNKWLRCVDETKNPSLRKCDWERLGV